MRDVHKPDPHLEASIIPFAKSLFWKSSIFGLKQGEKDVYKLHFYSNVDVLISICAFSY